VPDTFSPESKIRDVLNAFGDPDADAEVRAD